MLVVFETRRLGHIVRVQVGEVQVHELGDDVKKAVAKVMARLTSTFFGRGMEAVECILGPSTVVTATFTTVDGSLPIGAEDWLSDREEESETICRQIAEQEVRQAAATSPSWPSYRVKQLVGDR